MIRYFYFYGKAYQKIKDDDFGELEYDEEFEKIIEAKNEKEAKSKLKKKLSEFDRIEIIDFYETDDLAMV